ncbi:MAG: ChaN family lipoprotein [Desulfuromonadaceae bacterium]|nr:ChaN family lipoprotein [Desulfuromonadaceae bacterium]MDD5104565.1 ChaN family lipoprotein [Desulfuromonadaceae bacterium]
MIKTTYLLILLLCYASLPAFAGTDGAIIRLSDRQAVTFPQMIAGLQGAEVVFVGETHDDKRHHDTQLGIIRTLQMNVIPQAIGLEMFQSDSQKQLDDWVEGNMSEQRFVEIYRKNWSYDWSLYRDIFIYARDNRIPLIALNIPKAIILKVARQGYASLTPAELKHIPPGVSCDLNNPQTDFLRKTFQEVFKHEANGRLFGNFCEAQAVRNSGMAQRITTGLKQNPGRTMVVLAGTWHAVKHGVPDSLEGIGNHSYMVVIQEITELGRENATAALADYLIER